MSEYVDIITDFSSRCRKLFLAAEEVPALREYDVTLLLMTAAAAFVIPFERLNPCHLSGDAEDFIDLTGEASPFNRRPFVTSRFCPRLGSWRYGERPSAHGAPEQRPEQWPELYSLRSVPPQMSVGYVLITIRNALAHGNILTKGNHNIDAIVFISEMRLKDGNIGYRFLQVSPSDFRKFLTKWLEFLSKPGARVATR